MFRTKSSLINPDEREKTGKRDLAANCCLTGRIFALTTGNTHQLGRIDLTARWMDHSSMRIPCASEIGLVAAPRWLEEEGWPPRWRLPATAYLVFKGSAGSAAIRARTRSSEAAW